MKDIFVGTNIKKIYGDLGYNYYTIPKNELLIKLNLKQIITPEFQRDLNTEKINSIYKLSNDNSKWYNTHGQFIIGKLEKINEFDYYLLDGQHRIEALKQCKNDFLVIILIINFESINSMRDYFKSINQNTNFEVDYQIYDDQYIEFISLKLKKYIEGSYKDLFIKSKESSGNRYNINEFLQLFTSDVIEDFYTDAKIEYDDGTKIIEAIEDINKVYKDIFNNYVKKRIVYDYISKRDDIVLDKNFYLCLKNIHFIDSIRNADNEIPDPTKIKEKRPVIDKKLRDQVWNKYIGKELKKGKCHSCKEELYYENFESGHLISHKNGGRTDLDNLRPFCSLCNKSLNSKNFVIKN
jgi:hypothetical protein